MRIIHPDWGDRRDWLESRQRIIGGSDIAAVCGLSRWASPYSLWQTKTGRAPLDELDTVPIDVGNALEPVACRWLGRYLDREVTRHELLIVGGQEPWHGYSPDGTIVADEHLVEAKAVSSRAAGAWWNPDGTETVPVSYLLQVQWGMAAYGWKRCWITALIDMRHEVRVVDYDDALVDDLMDAAGRFWWHIEHDIAPDVDASPVTEQILKRLPAAPEPSIVELTDDAEDWHTLLARRANAMRLTDEWATEKRLAENRLRAAMGKHTEAHLDGHKVATWRPGKNNTRTLRITYTPKENTE